MYQCILLYGNDEMHLSKTGGPFRIATELRKNNYSVLCIDLTAFSNSTTKLDPALKLILSKAIGKNTLWVGISGSFLWNIFGLPYHAEKLLANTSYTDPQLTQGITSFIDFVKSLNSDIRFLIGGSRSWDLSAFGFVTFQGYVDREIVTYTKWLNDEKTAIPLSFYSNCITNKEYDQFTTSQIIYHEDDIVLENETLTIETARGCIFKCKFCGFPLNGKTKGEWVKQANILKDELIQNYQKHGVTKYYFSDDTYNDSIDKIKFLYDEVYSKLPFKPEFTSYLRLDLMCRFPESAEILKQSGLKSATFGIETLNTKSAKSIGKGMDPFDQLDYLRELKKSSWKDIITHSAFIFGLPHDTEEDFEKFDEWATSDRNPLDDWKIEPLYIVPKEFFNVYYFSFLDHEYASHDYEILTNEIPKLSDTLVTLHPWRNSRTGLDFETCFKKAKELNAKHWPVRKTAMWGYFYYQRFGLPAMDLLTNTNQEIDQNYRIAPALAAEKTKYKVALIKQMMSKQK
jgi:radical SAM superfamily enzyme